MLFAALFSLSESSADDPNTFVYDARHVFAKLDYIDGTLERTRVAGGRLPQACPVPTVYAYTGGCTS